MDNTLGQLVYGLNALTDAVEAGDIERARGIAGQIRGGALGQLLTMLRDMAGTVPGLQQQAQQLAQERDMAQAEVYRLRAQLAGEMPAPNGAAAEAPAKATRGH